MLVLFKGSMKEIDEIELWGLAVSHLLRQRHHWPVSQTQVGTNMGPWPDREKAPGSTDAKLRRSLQQVPSRNDDDFKDCGARSSETRRAWNDKQP